MAELAAPEALVAAAEALLDAEAAADELEPEEELTAPKTPPSAESGALLELELAAADL